MTTTYDPAAGTGQLLCNPPFATMTDSDHQDLIETACHNACQAMRRESERAHREQRSPEACLILAAALEAMTREGVTGDDLPACIDRLRRSAAPRRVES
jgi:hypothetical protein